MVNCYSITTSARVIGIAFTSLINGNRNSVQRDILMRMVPIIPVALRPTNTSPDTGPRSSGPWLSTPEGPLRITATRRTR